jgi:DUF4097 and DUF4098 domain-containing protein YvlB
MSTPPNTPPNVPPGVPPGGYPPYDPKTQWRAYREQQKAAWRAQRDAWRAQKHAWKSGYVGAYGPRVPSMVGPLILIGIGIVALLVVSGHISGSEFWAWYGHWWPLLLIGAGLALLGEWALDLRRKTPVRRTGNFVGLLVLMAFLGMGASGWRHVSPWMWQFNGDNDLFNFGPQRENDLQPISQAIPAGATVDIEVPHGGVSVTAGDGPNVEVQAHEVAYTDSDSDAKNIWNAVAPHLTVTGTAVLLKSQGDNKGRVNLTVTVPKSARVTINDGWDDVVAAGLGAGIDVTTRGNIQLNSITGPVMAHFTNGKHDEFSAHDVQGDLTLHGDVNEITLSEIHGTVTQDGDIPDDVHLESISGPVHLHTTVSTIDLASLPGDLTLDSNDLRVTEAQGTVHVTTHAKDVDLSQIYGDSIVENRDGRISVEPAGSYGIQATNDKGDVEITLPPNANATVEGHTRNGEIMNDYGLTVSGDQDKTVSGKIGAGGPTIQISSDNGDLGIKKGPAFPPAPPAVPAAPKAPAPPNAPHLKSQKALPAAPESQ